MLRAAARQPGGTGTAYRLGAVGLAAKQRWLFPSLGPTVMLAFTTPGDPSAQPRNAVIGRLVGIAAGAGCLAVFGLTDRPPAPVGGLTAGYVLAGALSVGLTTLVLVLLRSPHPPAGASTLIVSLGILTSAREIAVMVGTVLLVIAAAWALNLLLGVRAEHAAPEAPAP